uniref:uncharacterized protein LOC105351674 n=1 Tax=Fragaria vesca subsp. vesca TaxID=101020 RepID=UPI0005C90025|nr:PREDICTED: uncharacterized protein LOC105351674 [Fragaria vesca subsp. vesca]
MSLLRDESTAVTKPDGSKTFLYGRLRFPFRACEPGYLDRHPLPIPPPCFEGELLPKRKIFMRDTRDGELLPKGGCAWVTLLMGLKGDVGSAPWMNTIQLYALITSLTSERTQLLAGAVM